MSEQEYLSPNQRRSLALAGKPRSLEFKASVMAGRAGHRFGTPEWRDTYEAALKELQTEEAILEMLESTDSVLTAPPIDSRRTQFAKLLDDATTVVTIRMIDPQKLATIIHKRRRKMQDETWHELGQWLGNVFETK